MFCIHCGEKNQDVARFCVVCGKTTSLTTSIEMAESKPEVIIDTSSTETPPLLPETPIETEIVEPKKRFGYGCGCGGLIIALISLSFVTNMAKQWSADTFAEAARVSFSEGNFSDAISSAKASIAIDYRNNLAIEILAKAQSENQKRDSKKSLEMAEQYFETKELALAYAELQSAREFHGTDPSFLSLEQKLFPLYQRQLLESIPIKVKSKEYGEALSLLAQAEAVNKIPDFENRRRMIQNEVSTFILEQLKAQNLGKIERLIELLEGHPALEKIQMALISKRSSIAEQLLASDNLIEAQKEIELLKGSQEYERLLTALKSKQQKAEAIINRAESQRLQSLLKNTVIEFGTINTEFSFQFDSAGKLLSGTIRKYGKLNPCNDGVLKFDGRMFEFSVSGTEIEVNDVLVPSEIYTFRGKVDFEEGIISGVVTQHFECLYGSFGQDHNKGFAGRIPKKRK